jgi:hypothetical protein
LSLSSAIQSCKFELVGGAYCKSLKAFAYSTGGCLIKLITRIAVFLEKGCPLAKKFPELKATRRLIALFTIFFYKIQLPTLALVSFLPHKFAQSQY